MFQGSSEQQSLVQKVFHGSSRSINPVRGRPWRLSSKESAGQCEVVKNSPPWSQEDPTCHGAIRPCATPIKHELYRVWELQPLSTLALEPVLRNKRSPHNEKPAHRSSSGPHTPQLQKSPHSNEDLVQPKINT